MKKIIIPVLLTLSLATCHRMSRLDYTSIHNRAGWQRTARVVQTLDLKEGDTVADIGAGKGYFTIPLAQAVGPTGRVFAVEVDPNKIPLLKQTIKKSGLKNITIIKGKLNDPLLPDGALDLVFLCNSYHHIGNRKQYFADLKRDLKPKGHLAVVDLKHDLKGLLSTQLTDGHWTPRKRIYQELNSAGYTPHKTYDFLALQNFEVFAIR